MNEPVIYNCHIHTLTADEAPSELLKLYLWPPLGRFASFLLRIKFIVYLMVKILPLINPKSDNDLLERQARFLETGAKESQQQVFAEIQKQYPPRTKFVVLAMDTHFAELGKSHIPIDQQHQNLLELAKKNPNVIPFYAADPRHDDIVRKIQENVVDGCFRGIKIYPNLGYPPDDSRLIAVYQHCVAENVPVMSHCSPGGFWQFGLSESQRRAYSQPQNYAKIWDTYPDLQGLRICLAHFGGDSEWERHLKSREDETVGNTNTPWVKVISDLIRSGKYPNLYTDISYTLFLARPEGEQVEYCDYLKVLLEDRLIREHVLFGSDFYMSKREKITEKELSIMLRSRLGEKLYFQIANKNPRKFLYGEN